MSGTIAWDERHQKLYFAITTGTAWEKVWVIYNYSLLTRRVARFTSTTAGELGLGEVSPSGQYLAYLKAHHTAPALGCGANTDIEIVDLWNLSVISPALDFTKSDGLVSITRLSWPSQSSLEHTGAARRPDCTEILDGQVDGRIEVRSLAFH